jgi:hypothetical protein
VHAVASYIYAERAGVLVSAPAAGPVDGGEPGVTVSYWPFADVGTRFTKENSNRDYVGVLTAAGADAATVTLALSSARARCDLEIRE